MATVADHYAEHLAPVYLWMAGGTLAAFQMGEADLQHLRGAPGLVVDLGAGFGMHAIPLAKAGFHVLAIDSSEHLLRELQTLASGLPVEVRCADLLQFADFLPEHQRPSLITCMGDTLTHLIHPGSVQQLASRVAAVLPPGGRFVATFRDYTRLPAAEARFIPVRSDDTRILTCFLEEHPDGVQVHDILQERAGGKWLTSVSSYRKLRLDPLEVQATFAASGLQARVEPGPRGMCQLVADVPLPER